MGVLGGEGFSGLLVSGAALVAAASAAWSLLVLVAGTVEAATEGRIAVLRFTGCPAAWRRQLLRLLVPVIAPLLGVGTLTAASASPGPARPGHGSTGPALAMTLDGLPLPDRQPDAAAVPAERPSTNGLEVRPGDTLWQLAAGLLPSGADTREVAELCRRLYAVNRALIGEDPDVIRPGQQLRVPGRSGPRHSDPAAAHPEEEHR